MFLMICANLDSLQGKGDGVYIDNPRKRCNDVDIA